MVLPGLTAMGVESGIETLRPDPEIGCLSFRYAQYDRRQSHSMNPSLTVPCR